MIFIENEGVSNPRLNLALEEYALRNFDSEFDYLLFYINEPSIIIGRSQNTLEEINHEYIEKNNIHVVRRVSGGGAVFHDLGNLNFTFLMDKNLQNLERQLQVILEAVKQLGIQAEFSGRNDILVDGKKFSGNAFYEDGDSAYHHGTLLINSNMNNLAKYLQVSKEKVRPH